MPITIATGYTEPGYTNDNDLPIALANWNDRKLEPPVQVLESCAGLRMGAMLVKVQRSIYIPSRLKSALERCGVHVLWEGDWHVCSLCDSLVRSRPDGYDWLPNFVKVDDAVACGKCVEEDPQPSLQLYEGDHKYAWTLSTQCLTDNGYRRLDLDLERGLHAGQDSEPKVVAASLRDRGITKFIFTHDSCGQFDIKFSVWVHEDEALVEGEERHLATQGSSPSKVLEKVLKTIDVEEVADKDNISITTLDLDKGTSKTRHVTREEFLQGLSSSHDKKENLN